MDLSFVSPSAAWNVCYCLTGIAGVLGVQYLDYEGAVKSPSTGLSVLPMFVGLLVLCTPGMFAASGSKLRQWDRLFPALALLNITGEITSQLCIATAGSGTYIVIYSSMTVFTVIFRKIFLNKSVTWAMLSGILIIMAGLAITVGGIKGQGGGSMVLGVFSGFASALLYAGYYVMGEAVLCVPLTASTVLVSPWSLGAFEGYTFTILYLPYAVFLLFNGKWDSLVAQPMADAQADGSTVGFCYLVLILTNGLHMVALLKLLRHTDAIVAGVNKAVQAIAVFVCSSILYCHRDQDQCLTPLKGGSIVVVIIGVAVYSTASWYKSKQLANRAAAPEPLRESLLQEQEQERSSSGGCTLRPELGTDLLGGGSGSGKGALADRVVGKMQ